MVSCWKKTLDRWIKINEANIRFLTLLIFFFGLIVSYVVTQTTEPPEVNISKIDETMIGNYVSVTGFLVNIPHDKNGTIFFKITDGKKSINAVIFSSYSIKINNISNLKKGSKIKVIGRINEYNKHLEIVVEKLIYER